MLNNVTMYTDRPFISAIQREDQRSVKGKLGHPRLAAGQKFA